MLIEFCRSVGGDGDGSYGIGDDDNVVIGRNVDVGNGGRGRNGGGGDNGRYYGNSCGSNVDDGNGIYGCVISNSKDSGVKGR